MSIFSRIRAVQAKRAAYVRTVAEIEALSREGALDTGIDPLDARRIARKAVYGA